MNPVFPPPISPQLVLGFAALVLGLAAFAVPSRLRSSGVGRLLVSGRILLTAIGAVLTLSSFFSGATPESELANPIPRTVTSIDMGGRFYTSNCAACHGIDARGGGADSGSTPVRPPALAGPGSHLGGHTDGDLHYWIANGLPGGMPAWADTLSNDEIWHIVNYLRSINGAGAATEPPAT